MRNFVVAVLTVHCLSKEGVFASRGSQPLTFQVASWIRRLGPERSSVQSMNSFATRHESLHALKKRSAFAPLSAATTDASVLPDSVPKDVKNGAWLPIGSAESLVGDVPTSIEVVGIKLAVWRNGTTWSVMRDACPHRLAPLSQGRVDPTTGCIECPYHGWQFAAGGACTRIPQLEPERRATGEAAAGRTGATSFPVRLTGDLIWAFLPLPPGQVRAPLSPSLQSNHASGMLALIFRTLDSIML
jgi:nitrite reductase/ring-hydroxylating ferredoxin subunit